MILAEIAGDTSGVLVLLLGRFLVVANSCLVLIINKKTGHPKLGLGGSSDGFLFSRKRPHAPREVLTPDSIPEVLMVCRGPHYSSAF